MVRDDRQVREMNKTKDIEMITAITEMSNAKFEEFICTFKKRDKRRICLIREALRRAKTYRADADELENAAWFALGYRLSATASTL